MSIWVLFDLDGTLVDNSEGITKSTQFALDSYGYPNQPMETLKKFIGPPLHESFMEFYGFSKEQAFEAVDRYRVRYKEKGRFCRERLRQRREKGLRPRGGDFGRPLQCLVFHGYNKQRECEH